MHEQMGNFQRKNENSKNELNENAENKHMIAKRNGSFNRLISRLDTAKKRIFEIECK